MMSSGFPICGAASAAGSGGGGSVGAIRAQRLPLHSAERAVTPPLHAPVSLREEKKKKEKKREKVDKRQLECSFEHKSCSCRKDSCEQRGSRGGIEMFVV